jgi:hypothetical protein
MEPKAGPAPEPPPDPVPKELEPEALYEKVVRSCVFLVTPTKGGHATADGFLIDAEKRLVLTTFAAVGENDHTFVQFSVRDKDGTVLTDKRKYIERIPAGQAIKGKVLFRDKSRDLALVQLERLPPDTFALPFAPESVPLQSAVYWIGHWTDENEAFIITAGTVREVRVQDLALGVAEVYVVRAKMLLSITTPRGKGPNGGPIVDTRGRLVGLAVSFHGHRFYSILPAMDVTEVRAFLAEKKVDVATPRPWPDPPIPAAARERAADEALQWAKSYVDYRDEYRSRLTNLIRKYPGTAAAQEAKKFLDETK